MKNIYFIFLIITILYGCDHMHNGICIKNFSPKGVYIIQEKNSVLNIKKDYRSWSYSKILNQDTIWDERAYNYIKSGDSLCESIMGYEKDYQDYLKEMYTNNFVYCFIISKEIFRHQPWDSIVEKQMYENVLVYSIDSLKKMNWKVEYKGKYVITNPPPVGN